jgi:secreted Zn-dependent insulinase-like peptidase
MAEIEIKSFVDSKKLAAFYHAFTQAVHDFKTEFGQEQFESLRERELWLVKDRQDDIEYEIEQAIWDTIHFHEIATSEQQLRALQSMSLTTIYEYFDRVIPKSKGHVFISGQTNQRVRKEITKIWAENPAK